MNTKLKAVIDSIEFYQATYPEDACILIFDTERVVAYKRGKVVDLKIKIGETVEKHSKTTSIRALRSGKFLREERGPELFGFAYIASSLPIYDEGKLVGVVTGVISNEKTNNMRRVATELSSSVEEMTATTEELTVASTDVSKRLEELARFSDSMSNDIQQINSIVNVVRDIALKSKILGLNASIEAARSGEHGRGFAVVANEIQKMAQSSTESADNIAKQLEKIKESITYINGSTTQIAAFTEEYTASMHEMSDAYSGIHEIGQKLMELGQVKG
ncbi:methyl-accepting chemotaxis protein [Solibacillus sp. FSL H8-0538]|uniref:methyl-accepting chemotaxis protein n=1 Tax=Solibacillus sp. FSL H8-0538 TaxID=2921400 RepID=UPI0030F53CB9